MADQATSTAAQAPTSSPPDAPTAETQATAQVGAAPDAPAGTEPAEEPRTPGFGERGRMRRRLRFLRKARELAYRDLGGLIFEMHRLGERHDELAAAKLATLSAIDSELRALEQALANRRPVTVLREAGIAACPRCAAIHGSEDRFCPACGTPMDRRADRPIATAPTPAAPTPQSPPTPTPQPPPTPTPQPPPTPTPQPPPTPTPQPPPTPTPQPPPTATPQPPPAPTPAPTPTPPTPPAPSSTAKPAPAAPPTPAPPTPAPTASATPTPAQTAATKATDDRPTEIIRPADADTGDGA